MGKKAKISKKKMQVGGNLDNKEIYEIFNKIIGSDKKEIHICYPIYTQIYKTLSNAKKALSIVLDLDCLGDWRNDFKAMHDQIGDDIIAYASMEFTQQEVIAWEKKLDKKTQDTFSANFDKLIGAKSVLNIIGVANGVKPYIKELSTKKIKSMNEGFTPFSDFSTIDLYHLYLDIPEDTANVITMFTTKMYKFGISLYKQIRKPTIDTKEFAGVIKQILAKVKKNPKLNRFDKAFKLIDGSTDLLDQNFDVYYRDFMETGNPTSILQSYILDVADGSGKDKKVDFETLAQLKQIIAHFKQLQAQNPKAKNNSTLNKVFDEATKKFDLLDQKTNNLSGKNKK